MVTRKKWNIGDEGMGMNFLATGKNYPDQPFKVVAESCFEDYWEGHLKNGGDPNFKPKSGWDNRNYYLISTD